MEVRNELIGIISDYVEIPADSIDTSENLKFSAGLDSFATLSMISSIEDRFNLSIPDSKLAEFKTLDDIIGYVEAEI